MEITQSLLHELFEYSAGELYWKVTKTNRVKVGTKAGTLRNDGYTHIEINKRKYLTHRLIWLYFNKEVPKFLDHINNNRADNRIENLRSSSSSENSYNRNMRSDNTTGVKGVQFRKDSKKWRVILHYKTKKVVDVTLENFELAKLVAEEARLKYHGEYANHGKQNENASNRYREQLCKD